jgi:zinc transport system permease protein
MWVDAAPAASGGAGKTAIDDFDALLEPTSPEPAPRAAPVLPAHPPGPGELPAVEGSSHGLGTSAHGPSRLQDFADGWPLYRDPVLCGVLAGAALGALGVFVVLRRAVFITATLSQAAGLGVALAFFVDIQYGFDLPPLLGALVMSGVATLLVAARPPARVARETLVGGAFVTTSALAVLVGDRIAHEAHDIAAVLFGTAVLVRPLDLGLVVGGAVLTLVVLVVIGRALTFTGFDPEGARVQGLPVRAIESCFWLVFATVVSVATRALGALPVFALAVLPAAAGLAGARRLRTALAVGSLGGASAGAAGYVLAYFQELPVGASQATCAAVFAVLAYSGMRALPVLRRG